MQHRWREGLVGARSGADPGTTLEIRGLVHHRQRRPNTLIRDGCIPSLELLRQVGDRTLLLCEHLA